MSPAKRLLRGWLKRAVRLRRAGVAWTVIEDRDLAALPEAQPDRLAMEHFLRSRGIIATGDA